MKVKILVSIFLAFLLLVGCDTTNVSNPDDNNTNQKDDDNNNNNNNDNENNNEDNDNDNLTYPKEANEVFLDIYGKTINNLNGYNDINLDLYNYVKVNNLYYFTMDYNVLGNDDFMKFEGTSSVDFIYSDYYDYIQEEVSYIQYDGIYKHVYTPLINSEGEEYYIKQTQLKSTDNQDVDTDDFEWITGLSTDEFTFYQTSAEGDEFKFSIDVLENKNLFLDLYDSLLIHVGDEKYLDIDEGIEVYYKFNKNDNTLSYVRYDLSKFLVKYNSSYSVLIGSAPKLENFKLKWEFTYDEQEMIEIDESKVIIDQPDLPLEETYLFNINKIGDNFDGIIDFEGDMDYFKLQIDNTGKYYFDLSTEDPIFLDIYDENGVPIKDFYFQENDGSYIHQDFAVHLNEGVYYIEVMPLDSTLKQSAYSFTVEEIETDDIGDTFEEGTYKNITESGTYNGSIDYIGDIDVYNLDLYSDGIAVIKIVTENDLVIMFHRSLNDGTYEDVIMRPGDNKMTLNYYVFSDRGGYFAISSDSFIGDYSVDIEVYDDLNDLPNQVNDNLPIYEADEEINDAKHNFMDGYDYFTLRISESSMYELNYGIDYIFGNDINMSITIYDMNEEIVYSTNDYIRSSNVYLKYFELSEGDYLVKVKLEKPETYSLIFKKITDDYKVPELIDLENINELNFSSDYPHDIDEFNFTITEEMYYTFTHFGSTMRIYDANGIKLKECFGILSFYFIPGDYTIKFTSGSIFDVNVLIEKDITVHDDYFYKDSTSDDRIGELIIGDNTISIDYIGDKDSYKLVILHDGYYRFDRMGGDTIKYYQSIEEKRYISWRDTIYLVEGVYYFDFEEDRDSLGEFTFSIKEVYDDYTEPNNIDIINSNEIIGSLELRDDEDIFKFSITSSVCYILDSEFIHSYSNNYEGSNRLFDLYNSENVNLINYKNYNITSLSYCFEPGDYYLKVSNLSGYDYYDYKITITEIPNIVNDYSNLLSDSDDKFGSLEAGENTIYFDYEEDEDIYVLNLDGNYVYRYLEHNLLSIEVFDKDFNRVFSDYSTDVNNIYNRYVSLEPGKYYVRVKGHHDQEYCINFSY